LLSIRFHSDSSEKQRILKGHLENATHNAVSHKENHFLGSLMEFFPQLGNRISPWIAPTKVDACFSCMLRHNSRGHDDVLQYHA